MSSGIQNGSNGGKSMASTAIDKLVKRVSEQLAVEYQQTVIWNNYLVMGDISYRTYAKNCKGILKCDAGFFYHRSSHTLLLSGEAKQQGDPRNETSGGNGIDRIGTDCYYLRSKYPDHSFVCYNTGSSAQLKSHGERTCGMLFASLNEYNPGGVSWYMSVHGFTEDFVYQTLKAALIERIEHIDKISNHLC